MSAYSFLRRDGGGGRALPKERIEGGGSLNHTMIGRRKTVFTHADEKFFIRKDEECRILLSPVTLKSTNIMGHFHS